jgi:hypothetical protein
MTLGEALASTGLPTDDVSLDDLNARVVDFTSEQSDGGVAVAYFGEDPNRGSQTLHVRVRGVAGGAWRHATVDAQRAQAITQVRRAGANTIVDLHVDADANHLLVLDEQLVVTARLEGTSLAVLPDGVLVIQEDVRALVPTRPFIVSTYALASGETRRLHPTPPWGRPRQHFVDQVKRAYASWGMKACIAANHHCNAEQFDGALLSAVRADARGRRLAWIQRLGPPDGARNGPVDFNATVLVTCDRETGQVGGRCRERAFGSYDGPDGTKTVEALNKGLAGKVR